MKKGLIICGYPGIGKSSIAGWNNCIDLESSYFSHDDEGNRIMPDEAWVKRYCDMAILLARQGYTVMVSTHMAVVDQLKKSVCEYDRFKWNPRIIILAPHEDLKEAWAQRLLARWISTSEYHVDYEKNYRAFAGGITYFHSNIASLIGSHIPIYFIRSIDYDLRDHILRIRGKEKDDNEETNSSLEQVAGVEKACLDDSMVEENSDTSRDHSE